MQFRKTQVKRGQPQFGFVWHAYEDGCMVFEAQPIHQEPFDGQDGYRVGAPFIGEWFPTLDEAKAEVRRMLGR